MADRNFSIKFDGLLDLDNLTILEEDKNGTRLYKLKDALLYFNVRNVKLSIAEKDEVAPTDDEE